MMQSTMADSDFYRREFEQAQQELQAMALEIKRLGEQLAYDAQLNLDLGKRNMALTKENEKLKEELNELRSMQSESTVSGGSSPAEVRGTMPGTHARQPMLRAGIGD